MSFSKKIIIFLLHTVIVHGAIIYKPTDWFYNDMLAYIKLYEKEHYQTNWHKELKAHCVHLDFSQQYLQDVQEKYSDEIALFRCKTNPHSFISIIWPVTKKYPAYDKIPKILSKYGAIRYVKKVPLKNNGPLMLIKHAYGHETWLGNWTNNFYGIRSIKENICFPSYLHEYEIDVYLLEFENLDKALAAKYRIRKFFDLRFNSIHITDTQKEAISLAQVLFNKNSIDFLNEYQLVKMSHFEKLLKDNKKWLANCMENGPFCLTGKAIKAAYGQKDCKEISFVSKQSNLKAPIGFKCKNKSIKNIAKLDKFIHNPQSYFMYNEIKFLKQ